jgi:hypothetical protein
VTPGTVVLLHATGSSAAAWGDLPGALRLDGPDVIVPDVPEDAGPRYVARAALAISAAVPVAPLLLVARGDAGPLVPGVALAQRAAHRKIGGYVFLDADLPRPATAVQQHDHGEPSVTAVPSVPIPPDWPEAPCAYLRTADAGPETGGALTEARLRGWTVTEQARGIPLARVLRDLIAAL